MAPGDLGAVRALLTGALAVSGAATTGSFGRLLRNATPSPERPRGLHALLGALTSRS
ncbi:hypothetical protein ABXS69_00935 [Actinomyces timonensis]|uniref:Uncharacterized protein n=1 Tax=Actinomyces timonensis TaxID=1288391 RepID=A0AAU8N2D5_9ACTO